MHNCGPSYGRKTVSPENKITELELYSSETLECKHQNVPGNSAPQMSYIKPLHGFEDHLWVVSPHWFPLICSVVASLDQCLKLILDLEDLGKLKQSGREWRTCSNDFHLNLSKDWNA